MVLFSFSLTVMSFAEDGIDSKTFTIKFRKLNDVTLKIKPFLSREAKVNLNYSDNSIEVEDYPANLNLVEREIKRFDRQPYKIGIRVRVIFAEKDDDKRKSVKTGVSLPEDISYIPNELNKILKYTRYNLFDTLSIQSKEGENYTMSENDRYNLHFYSDYIDTSSGAVVLKDFTLFLKSKLPSGVTVSKRLLKTDINLIPGQKLILGGAKKDESPEAIFFVIETETVK